MSWNEALGELKTRLPGFNDYLLTGFRREQVDNLPEHVDLVFKEAVKLFSGSLKYNGYKELTPEQRINYCIDNVLIKGKMNVQRSELRLMEYIFEYDGQTIPLHIYLPYMYNDSLIINDTTYFLQLAIIERVIFRVTDGVIIKVMRSPLQFWRTEQYSFTAETGETFYDSIITVKAHYKKDRVERHMKTTLLLYLLAQFQFDDVLNKLGFTPEMVSFTQESDPMDKEHLYFKCQEHIYVRIDKEAMRGDINLRRFLASLLYILQNARPCTIGDVRTQELYKAILGKIIHGEWTKDTLAAGHAVSHLKSLSTYLDKNTKDRLALMHIYCDDIFDLFITVFFNIDYWLVSYSPNDLFEKRIGGADLILADVIKQIFTHFYETLKHNKILAVKNIRTMLHMDPMRISSVWKISCLQPNSSLYNDNMLFSTKIKKIRQTSIQNNEKSKKSKSNGLIHAKEHQFHPSFAAIESLMAISSSSPGSSGDINPYAVIDKLGYFQKDKMPWYKEVEPIMSYLVRV